MLIVDDEVDVRQLLARLVRADGHTTVFASSGQEARTLLASAFFELVLCDVSMPGESGFDVARHIVTEHPETAVVMVSGLDDPEAAEAALDLGAFGYVVKPFKFTEIPIAVANALRRRRLELENRAHRERLEETVATRTAALQAAVTRLERQERELQESREETIRRLARAAEYRDHETGRHIERVSRYAFVLAQRCGLPDEECELIRIAAPLHDIGKIAIPDRILLKPGPLTPSERGLMEGHPELGYRLLSGSGQKLLDLAASIAWTHHERFDGLGYPRRLAGEAIPLEGRIAAVADVFDALTSDRVYRPALTVDETLRMIRDGRGTSFDPRLVDFLLAAADEIVAIRAKFADHPRELPDGVDAWAISAEPAASRAAS